MADVERWITVHPNGADSKGQPIPVKEGQSKGEAVKSFVNKHKSEVKKLNKKSIDELKKEITQDSNNEFKAKSPDSEERNNFVKKMSSPVFKKNKVSQEELKKNDFIKKIDVIKKLKSFEGKPVGTYNYDTGELVNLTDGYMVTFHQNEPDPNGHYKSHYGRYTSDEYDELTNKFAIDNDAEVYIGVFDDEPEISFKVKDYEDAKKLAILHNQDSIWDNKNGELWSNLQRDRRKNPLKGE